MVAGTAALALPVLACGQANVCSIRRFEGDDFSVCRYDPASTALRLVQADGQGVALRGFDRLARYLGSGAASVRFAMNAGMFDGDGAPIGLYVEDGVLLHGLNTGRGSGNFYMQPNGVFFVEANGRPGIETTARFAGRTSLPRWATQSGPMLVVDGVYHPQIAPDGASKYIRNAVGVTGDGTAVFAISEGPVSFGRLARFMRDEMDCGQALCLDGFVSSLWVPSLGRRDKRALLGPIAVVMPRR